MAHGIMAGNGGCLWIGLRPNFNSDACNGAHLVGAIETGWKNCFGPCLFLGAMGHDICKHAHPWVSKELTSQGQLNVHIGVVIGQGEELGDQDGLQAIRQ